MEDLPFVPFRVQSACDCPFGCRQWKEVRGASSGSSWLEGSTGLGDKVGAWRDTDPPSSSLRAALFSACPSRLGGRSVKIQMTDDQREAVGGVCKADPQTAALEPRHPLWVIDQSSVCVTQSWCKPSPGFLEEDAQFLLCV